MNHAQPTTLFRATVCTPEGALIDIVAQLTRSGYVPLNVGDTVNVCEDYYTTVSSKFYDAQENQLFYELLVSTEDFNDTECLQECLAAAGWELV